MNKEEPIETLQPPSASMGENRGEAEQWVVYLLRCADNSLYCGIAKNLQSRLSAHRKGQGAKYTRSRIPIELVGCSCKMNKSAALKLEYRVKQMPAGQKIAEVSKHR
jgi:putative endonuclease